MTAHASVVRTTPSAATRLVAAVVLVAGVLAGCTSGLSQPEPGQLRFRTSAAAIKAVCDAYWVGQYIQDSRHTERQWETQAQYRSGNGWVAQVGHDARGFFVTSCRGFSYVHG